VECTGEEEELELLLLLPHSLGYSRQVSCIPEEELL